MHRIVILTLKDSEGLHTQFFDHIRCLMLGSTEIFITESYNWKYIIIVDFSKCTFENRKYFVKISPFQLYKLIKLNEQTLTFRFEAIYIINAPALINSVFSNYKKIDKIQASEKNPFL